MLRKLFKALTLCGFFSLLCFALLLLYSKTSAPTLQPVTHRNNSSSAEVKEKVKAEEKEEIKEAIKAEIKADEKEAVKAEEKAEKTEDTLTEKEQKAEVTEPEKKKLLQTCPDNPPGLVGPLRVEFDYKGTVEELKDVVGKGLEMGGRFKPPDCVSQHKVAIIIPFRNRQEHLKHWLYYLHPILMRQLLDYGVYVINQAEHGIFNRAKLLNVGYFEALKEYDYDCFVFSDVDLVPMDDRNIYKCFDNPRHLAVGMDKFGYHLPYNTYFGGVSSMTKAQFQKINGCPNTYWGWGGEDDDLYNRVVLRGMSVSRPDLLTGRYRMVKHERDKDNEPNPVNPDKLRETRWKMNQDGLNTLKYKVVDVSKNMLYTYITVDIDAPPG